MSTNCNQTSNACSDCTSECETTLDSSCVFYTGKSVSCLSTSTNPTVQDMIYALGVKVCSISAPVISAWLLNGNSLSIEKSIGTLNNYRFPMTVNSTEVFALENERIIPWTDRVGDEQLYLGDISRLGIQYSVVSNDDGLDGFGNTSWGYYSLSNLTAGVTMGTQNTAIGWRAGRFLSTGNNNTFLGTQAGSGVTTSDHNICIGTETGGIDIGSNNILLDSTGGSNAYNPIGGTQMTQMTNGSAGCQYSYSSAIGGLATTDSSYQVVLGAGDYVSELVIGDRFNSYSSIKHDLTIRTQNPQSALNIPGSNIKMQPGLATGNAASGNYSVVTSVKGASGTGQQIVGDRLNIIGGYITLTESTATTFTSITIPTSTVMGGEVLLSVHAEDAVDFQCRTLRAMFSVVNKAGALTMTLSTPEEVVATSSGTLTCTITLVDAGGGVLNFKANATSSLTQTTLRCNVQFKKNFGTGVFS